MTDAVERMDPRCDAGGHGYMLWMEYRDDGGYVRATDYDALLDRIEELEAKLAEAVEALDEAVNLLAPDEKDMMRQAGVYRVVTTLAKLKG